LIALRDTPVIISASIITAAKRHGQKALARTASPGEPFTQVDEVVDLLAESTSPGAQPGARRLLQQMSTALWRLIRGAHASQDDATPHVTIALGRTRYHLRLDGRQCVFDITHFVDEDLQRLSGHDPWTPPGA
jgi:hypothetical protein